MTVRQRNFQRGAAPAHELAAQNGRTLVPPAVSAVLNRALALSPADRFPSVSDLAVAFRSALVEPTKSRAGPPSVFISYQRAPSSAWAILLKKELERDKGFQVFLDVDPQDRMGQFPVRLQRRIQQCDVFVCLLAQSTLASDWVKREIQLASVAGKPMIPVFQEGYRNPPNLRALEPHIQELLTCEGIKLLDLQNIFIDAAIQELIASARRCIETIEPRNHVHGWKDAEPMPQPANRKESFVARLAKLLFGR